MQVFYNFYSHLLYVDTIQHKTGKTTLSEQPDFSEFLLELRWIAVLGIEPRASRCSSQ